MKRLVLSITLLALGCSSPDSKLNSVPNATPNNVNGTPNNVNGTPNNVNGTPNNVNGTPNNVNSTTRIIVDPDDFDQSCEWDSECQMVWGGDICGCGTICGDAIAQSAVADFEDAIAAVDCTGVVPEPCPGAACQAQMAVCASGNCEAIFPATRYAEDFDRSCEVDADCTVVPQGQVCSECDCDRGAINTNAVEAYFADGQPDCNPGPQVCDCAPADTAYCDAGTCQVGFRD